MKVRVINKNYIETGKTEVIVEITVITKFWLWNITKVYRKVYGEYFEYKNNEYTLLTRRKKERIISWFKLPSEDSVFIK